MSHNFRIFVTFHYNSVILFLPYSKWKWNFLIHDTFTTLPYQRPYLQLTSHDTTHVALVVLSSDLTVQTSDID